MSATKFTCANILSLPTVGVEITSLEQPATLLITTYVTLRARGHVLIINSSKKDNPINSLLA